MSRNVRITLLLAALFFVSAGSFFMAFACGDRSFNSPEWYVVEQIEGFGSRCPRSTHFGLFKEEKEAEAFRARCQARYRNNGSVVFQTWPVFRLANPAEGGQR